MLTEGTTIGTYRVLKKIGEGGMGAVYMAEHTLLGRRAAVKVLLPELSAHKEIVQRFFNEARAVTQVADPGIVQVFDFGYDQYGSAFIVMELLEGEAMDKRLQRIGRFAPSDCLRLMRLICTSLHAAHVKGIIHRDLKPENIYIVGDPAVTGGERAKILDFGIAKLSADEPGKMKTRSGMMMGTPVYMSPEQCRGAGAVDHRSDIYTMGCVMMTMLTGKPPFDGSGSGELIVQHMQSPPPFASSRVPDLPEIVDQILQRCLAKDPAVRFQTMAELAQAIQQAEHQVMGMPGGGFAGGYNAQPTPGGYVRQPTPGTPGYQPHPTPGYQQQPTPYIAQHTPGMAHTPVPGPPKPTTLTNASGSQTTPPMGSSKKPMLIVIGASVVVGALIAVLMVAKMGGDEKKPTRAAGGNAGSGEVAQPAAADAAVVVETPAATPDAAMVVSAPVDAGVPDAAPSKVAATPVDAGVKRGGSTSKRNTGKKNNGNTTSGNTGGGVDRGD